MKKQRKLNVKLKTIINKLSKEWMNNKRVTNKLIKNSKYWKYEELKMPSKEFMKEDKNWLELKMLS